MVKSEIKQVEEKNNKAILDKAFQPHDLQGAWQEYAESRKSQIAEYHLLTQQIAIEGNEVIVYLTNSIEEPLLTSIKSDLVGYLRDKLSNSTIQIKGILRKTDEKQRIAYTNKEKFDVLLNRNPLLQELKDRFALDTDF